MAVPETRDNSTAQNDPTQALFSALGRFCRNFTRGQSLPNSPWPSDCMQELTASLKVCLDQNWISLQRALIDTARILSSYEHAGRAVECLPFLQKSHDILSLMVGDLILDRVTDLARYGWPDHYARAVVVLKNRGIELIEDDSETAVPEADEAAPPAETAAAPAHSEPEAPFEEPAFKAATATFADAPEMPIPEEPDLSVEPEPEETAEVDEVVEAEQEAEEEAVSQAPQEESWEPEGDTSLEAEPPAVGTAAPDPAPVVQQAPVQPANETVDALGAAVQQAILIGDVAQAKTLAIRLAAALARHEIDTAEGNLSAAKERLDANALAIQEGEQRVSDAEGRVQHAESEISARESESQACRERIAELDTEILGRKTEVADLDQQIQALQERRAQEAAALHERESERAAAVAGDSLIQTEIESLNEEEDAAREFLEAARTKLDTMRAERIRIEDEIAGICADVERRKRSVQAIERPLRGDDDDAEPESKGAPQENETEQSADAKEEGLLF